MYGIYDGIGKDKRWLKCVLGYGRWGVGDRGASVRVGNLVPLQKCGYLEDRRPSGDLDPYVVTKMLVETTLLPN